MNIGFIGLGLMGNPMSKNILKKGFSLRVWNRSNDKTTELASLGARIAPSPKELAESSEVIITMVTAGNDVEEVLFGEKGVVEGAKPGLIVIDMSTIGPTKAREIGKRLAAKKIAFIDAPVTGSTPKAKTGELTIFIGGKKDVYEKIKPVLEAMGTNLQYMGASGSGQAIKLINNHLAAASVEALAEGMLLADAMGMDRKKAAETLVTVPAVSDYMRMKIQNFVKKEYPLLFSTANMRKDLHLAMDETDTSLPLLAEVVSMYDEASEKGLGNEDISATIKVIEK